MNTSHGNSISGAGSMGTDSGLKTDVNGSVAIGYNCAPMLATGQSNTMVGYNCALFATSGIANTLFGYGVGIMSGGYMNTYVGTLAAPGAMITQGNSFYGAYAGKSVKSGNSNVVLGARADTLGDASRAVSVGSAAGAGSFATSVGCAASALGHDSVELGHGVSVLGNGCFSLADRLRGFYANDNPGGPDTYAVEVDADVLQLANGAALMWCARGGYASNATPAWAMQLGGERDSNADLVLTSAAGATVRFGNEFVAGVLDFTAQHSCRMPGVAGGPGQLAGRLVVATGRYVRAVTADDAVPCVELCSRAADPRVFGVVSAEQRPRGTYRVGHITFQTPDDGADESDGGWVTVNAAGEGGIWVCDEGGPLRNGDLLVSASAAPGMAMRQPGPQVVGAATAAKVTCDCGFDEPDAVEAAPGVRARLVGCVYKF